MANTQLKDFLALVQKRNIARINRFRLTFALPQKLIDNINGQANSTLGADDSFQAFLKSAQENSRGQLLDDAAKTISLTCLMVDMPARQENFTEIHYGNFGRKVANGRTYADVNMTFLVTGNYAEKKLFDAWHTIIVDESQTAIEFYDDYISTVVVECLDNQDEAVYAFTLQEAWPTAIGGIRMDRTAQNAQMVLDVNWAFHRVVYGLEPENPTTTKTTGNGIPPGIVPGQGSGKNRLFPIPGIDQFSDAVKTTVNTVKEFKTQLEGVLAVARDVREQVRDAKMQVLDGVKVLNGVVKDVKAIKNIPNDVRNEVLNVVRDTKNQLGSLKNEVNNFKNYPQR